MRLTQPFFRPWIWFNGPEVTGGGPTDLTDDQFREANGFPRNTKTDDMTDAEQAAYWRAQSKKQQADAKAKDTELAKWQGLGAFDAVSTTVTDAEAERQKNLTDQQRAQEEAAQREAAARAAGESQGASKHLKAAVEGQLLALTRRSDEEPADALARVRGALKFVDTAKFLNADGDLDIAEVEAFAASVAPTGPANSATGDPLAGMLSRQVLPQPGAAGSVASHREAAYERAGGKKTKS
ncbi:hypothetical protein [Microbacterium sp. VKM Ac-2923]|uniref:hypothetical protein n=1 Tax=Microbacterium sp. VKM Ac-2923 TaxID=2929476 RepID=UPI001FB4248A|nr:hypothetical protein [Microbacterium sp. VKM Ac-2923]MCJ1709235.1 hypothetical protein [Microbacterium sp. VKM Ac-2923]